MTYRILSILLCAALVTSVVPPMTVNALGNGQSATGNTSASSASVTPAPSPSSSPSATPSPSTTASPSASPARGDLTSTPSQLPAAKPAAYEDVPLNPAGDPTLGRLIGDISRGNHKDSGVANSPIIVPRPIKSQYPPVAVADTANVRLTDLDAHWARAAIEKFVVQGYIAGYPDGTFRPNATVTYAEWRQSWRAWDLSL